MFKKIGSAALIASLFSVNALAASPVEISAVTETDTGIEVSLNSTMQTAAELYAAVYNTDGTLKSVKKTAATLSEGDSTIAIEGGDKNARIFVWGENQQVLTDAYNSQPAETASPQATAVPTVSPTTEPSTPTAEPTKTPEGDGVIHLADSGIMASGIENVTIEDSKIKITAAGDYYFDGSLSDGQIEVASASKDDVINIYLDNVAVANSTLAAFSGTKGKVNLYVKGTCTFADTNSQTAADTRDNGCITNKHDLSIKSYDTDNIGTLVVKGNFENGIRCKNDLEIGNCNIDVTAVKSGIKGDSSVKFTKKALNVTVVSGGDGIKTDYIPEIDDETSLPAGGEITINGGEFNITTTSYTDASTGEIENGDGIQADMLLTVVNSPKITIKTDGDAIKANASTADAEEPACEGGDGCLAISGGTFIIDCGDTALRATSRVDLTDSANLTVNTCDEAVKAGEKTETVSGTTTTENVDVAGYVNISGGTINVITAANDAIVSRGDMTISGGNISGYATEDFIKAYEVLDISGGTIDIEAGNDGIQSGKALVTTSTTESGYTQGDVNITDGTINIKTYSGSPGLNSYGGGDSNSNTTTFSCKGIKANSNLNITGGNITTNTFDDAIHSNWAVNITGGNLDIKTGDDGVHADYMLTIGTEGGAEEDLSLTINECYEGIEGSVINMNSGTVKISAFDDGVNASGDYAEGSVPLTTSEDISIMAGPGGFNPGGGTGAGGAGVGGGESSSHGAYYNNGGFLYVTNSNGDGIDSNGTMTINGGVVIVDGATLSSEDGLDFSSSVTFNGGYVLTITSGGMDGISGTMNQHYALYGFSSGGMGGGASGGISAGNYAIVDSNNNVLCAFTRTKGSIGRVTFTSPELTSGTTYYIKPITTTGSAVNSLWGTVGSDYVFSLNSGCTVNTSGTSYTMTTN